MNRSSLALAAILSVAGFAAHAETPDPSGQFAAGTTTQQTRAAVQDQQAAAKQPGENPWATSYNPLTSFQSSRTRAEVRAEFTASRDDVAAMTGEDSGAFALAQQQESHAQVAGAAGDISAQ